MPNALTADAIRVKINERIRVDSLGFSSGATLELPWTSCAF